MSGRTPDREFVPPVQKFRLRYAKRGRLRFASHRDFQRAFERAIRRAGVAMAYSAGFSPHPRISYANAAPTGTASEAEYLEIGVAERYEADDLRARLDAALPPGLDIVEVVEARTPDFVQRLEASRWRIVLPGVDPADAEAAVAALLAQEEVIVERLTKNGMRSFDVRGSVLMASCQSRHTAAGLSDGPCAILQVVLRQATPAVRPDDVLAALRRVADLVPQVPAQVTREMQGPLADDGTAQLGDPLAADRELASTDQT